MNTRKPGRPPRKPAVSTNRWGTVVSFPGGDEIHYRNRAAHDEKAAAQRDRARRALRARLAAVVAGAAEAVLFATLRRDGLAAYAAARIIHLQAEADYAALRAQGMPAKAAAKAASARSAGDPRGTIDATLKRLQRRVAETEATETAQKPKRQ